MKIRILTLILPSLLAFSADAHAQQWVPLFDGATLNGWTEPDGSPAVEGGWSVSDNVLSLDRKRGRGGNILTDREYGDFELVFDWKIPAGSNNGIKYRVKDFDGRILGCEYQIIDDEGRKATDKHKTATLYDIYETRAHSAMNPPGHWNSGRILVRGNRIEHWINGHQVVAATVGSAEWDERIAKSKFRDVDGFGRNRMGRIMLTDHSDPVEFKNIFIREFSPNSCGIQRACNSCAPVRRCCPPAKKKCGLFGLFSD